MLTCFCRCAWQYDENLTVLQLYSRNLLLPMTGKDGVIVKVYQFIQSLLWSVFRPVRVKPDSSIADGTDVSLKRQARSAFAQCTAKVK